MALIQATDRGLYCPAGGFYIDPWEPVDRAVITHAHADHARPGSERYLAAAPGLQLLRQRLGSEAAIDTVPYGELIRHGDVTVSLHPAGHLLGSAQVRIEHGGEVCVISGDYKREADPTCDCFEPVPCDTFVTESTFALPIYRWSDPVEVFGELNAWWRENQEQGRTTIVYAYALGKAQRLLAGLDASIGPILTHGAVERFVQIYRDAGVALPATQHADAESARANRGRAVVIAPIAANGSTWIRKFRPFNSAFASGWMMVRGARRGRSVDRGFVLSYHADWPGLLATIDATGAEHVGVTHGHQHVLTRWLLEQGRDAFELPTRFEGEVAAQEPG